MSRRGSHSVLIVAALLALAAAAGVQAARDSRYPLDRRETERVLYVRSGTAIRHAALEFDALVADTYWIRAIQHYGGDRLAGQRGRKYDLLYPLLDITTTLDPYFTIAYRFGAIFLSEAYPGGPGRPDQAIALLRKGIAAQPGKWQYYMDIGFVNYWHLRDFTEAARWFQAAGAQPGAPNWLAPLAATVLQVGRDRASARFLWQQMLQSDQAWMRSRAEHGLRQVQALDDIDQLSAIARRFPPQSGDRYTWEGLVRRRVLRGIPIDPSGQPYEIDPVTGRVTLSEASSLWPLPDEPRRLGR